MSAKSYKIELSEKFMVMWREEQPPEVFCRKGALRNSEISKNTFSYRTCWGDCFQSLKGMSDKF